MLYFQYVFRISASLFQKTTTATWTEVNTPCFEDASNCVVKLGGGLGQSSFFETLSDFSNTELGHSRAQLNDPLLHGVYRDPSVDSIPLGLTLSGIRS